MAVYVLDTLLVAVVIAIYAIILTIQTGGRPDGAQIEWFATRAGYWGAPVMGVPLTVGAAAWAARKAGAAAVLHGVLVGLVVSLISLIIDVATGRLPDLRQVVMYILVVGVGWLGGVAGQAMLTGREALYQASQAIGAASSPQAIVAAIGEHLAGPEVSWVALWRVVSQDEDGTPTEITPLATWASRATQWPPGLRLDVAQVPALARLRQKTRLLLQTREAPSSERTAWERLGARSTLLLPLTTSDGAWVGVLMVASQRARGFSRGTVRTYLTIGTQAALALENLRLVEQVRQAAVLEERQRLARGIHDTLAQGFTSIVMHLEAAEQVLPASSTMAHQHLDQARRTARESLAEARRLVWALRPEHLERASLAEALERVVARWSEESSIGADVITTGTVCPLSPDVEVTLLRAAQEALTNVRKHARATQVTVTLSYMDNLIVLDVQDDGVGFDPDRSPTDPTAGGFGLRAMRERVEQLGGTLLIESAPGQGTTLVVEAPITPEVSTRQEGGWSTFA